MIEIKERNGNWEAYVDGALYDYSASLEDILEVLYRQTDDVIDFLNK